MTKIALTKREIQIMQILWNSTSPLSAREITETSNELNQNTVQAVLRKLLKANYITAASIGYSGTVLTRQYTAVLTQEEYLAAEMTADGMKKLVSSFIDATEKTQDLDDLEQLIQNKRNQLKK